MTCLTTGYPFESKKIARRNRIQLATDRCLTLFLVLCAILAAGSSKAHDSNFSQEPWAVCEAMEVNDSCAFTNSSEDIYRGTCQSMSGALICVRNQPIVRHSDLDLGHSHAELDHHHD